MVVRFECVEWFEYNALRLRVGRVFVTGFDLIWSTDYLQNRDKYIKKRFIVNCR